MKSSSELNSSSTSFYESFYDSGDLLSGVLGVGGAIGLGGAIPGGAAIGTGIGL